MGRPSFAMILYYVNAELQNACPKCPAQHGESCRYKTGRLKNKPCKARLDIYRRDSED